MSTVYIKLKQWLNASMQYIKYDGMHPSPVLPTSLLALQSN